MTEDPALDGLTPSIAGSEPETLLPVAPGERHFGRYVLRYEIASGGMATVYLARARGPAGFDRPLAIKRIHPHLAKKKDFVEMFLDEARLNARITHPNVCSVFDFGQESGTYFMAMEYLVGQPLSALLRALSADLRTAKSARWHALAARIVADACEGLHAAHELKDERGAPLRVVHRDATPHNIFVTYDGAVKVVDFGVAFAEGRLHQTESGTLKGKLGYMSPEQVRGKDLDRRVDVWALGVCLWELLALRRLFPRRSEVELIQSVVNDPIMAPSAVQPSVPHALDAIVLRALDRDLSKRYPTARAMARDLNAFASRSGESTSLADLSELMEEMFASEREVKLGVVARVLGGSPDSDAEPLPPGTSVSARGGVTTLDSDDLETSLTPSGVRADFDRGEPPLPLAPTMIAGDPQAVRRNTSPPEAQPEPRQTPTTLAGPRSLDGPRLTDAVTLARPVETADPMPQASGFAPMPIGEPAPVSSRRGPMIAAGVFASLLAVAAAAWFLRPSPAIVVTPVAPRSTATPPSEAPPEPEGARADLPTPPASGGSAEPPGPRTPGTTDPTLGSAVEGGPGPADPAEDETDESEATGAPSRPRTGPGTVNVAARGGWADIYVDGERVGRTPRSLTLRSGRHVIELRPGEGGPAVRRTVTVRAGQTTTLVEEL